MTKWAKKSSSKTKPKLLTFRSLRGNSNTSIWLYMNDSKSTQMNRWKKNTPNNGYRLWKVRGGGFDQHWNRANSCEGIVIQDTSRCLSWTLNRNNSRRKEENKSIKQTLHLIKMFNMDIVVKLMVCKSSATD